MSNSSKTPLFLDRDGVINRKLEGSYVRNWSEFEWLPGVVDAFADLLQYFYPIIVVTNQQGVGKGLMTETDLQILHERMITELKIANGVGGIHDIYYCPHLAEQNCHCRKPKPGMFLQATSDYPFIQLPAAIMVGDSASDMEAARSAGILSVSVGFDHKDTPLKIDSLKDLIPYLLENDVLASQNTLNHPLM